MTASVYFDLMVSNERTDHVSIRPLTANTSHLWAYEITPRYRGKELKAVRGTVTWKVDHSHDNPDYLYLVSLVLEDYYSDKGYIKPSTESQYRTS